MSRDLAKLQHAFQQYLLTGATAIHSLIRQPCNSDIQDRLAVYGEGYRTRLIECLQDDFPTLKYYAGDELFFQICDAYIDAFPSQSKSLCHYANHFVEFISCQPEFSQKNFFAELAQFEWSIVEILNLPVVAPALIENLHAIPHKEWPNIRFELQPNVKLNHYDWNIVDCWKALNKSQCLNEKLQQPNDCLIWRNQYLAYFKVLTANQLLIYQLMVTDRCFAVIGQALCDVIPEATVPGVLLETVMTWLDDGLISKIIS